MKSRWFKMVSRFWPGVMCLVVTFSLLTWLLQPRPRTFQSVQLPIDPSFFLESGLAYSPDRSLLATTFSGHIDDNDSKLIVYDLASREQLFKDPAVLSQFVFDGQGALLYLGGKGGKYSDPHTHEKLMRWNRATQQAEMIGELNVTERDLEFDIHDLVQETNHVGCLSALTADGQWWIVPRMDDTSLWYERLDTRTGISAGRLNLPAMKRERPHRQTISMCLTREKNVLLVETASWQEEKGQFTLHWIDLSTGQALHSVSLPNAVASYCAAQQNLTVVQTYSAGPDDTRLLMVFHGPQRELRMMTLDEIEKLQSNPPHYGKREMPTPEAVIGTYMVDAKSMTAIIGWRYCSDKTERAIGNGPPDFTEWSPEYYYSIRDLKTGDRLHTGCLHLLGAQNNFEIKNNTLDARTLLPGPVLVLSRYMIEDEPTGFFEKSLRKVKGWLNLSSGYLDKLHFIDARSGKVLNTLLTPYTGGRLSLSPDEKTLAIEYFWDGEEARIEYDYPLHSPWLLIWTWSLGVGLALTLLVELNQWRQRHLRCFPR